VQLCAADNLRSTAQTKIHFFRRRSPASEKRTSELAASFLPSAKITWLGSSEPAEHAEPDDAQMPSMSNQHQRDAIRAAHGEGDGVCQ